jgi:hypothetical protein
LPRTEQACGGRRPCGRRIPHDPSGIRRRGVATCLSWKIDIEMYLPGKQFSITVSRVEKRAENSSTVVFCLPPFFTIAGALVINTLW